MKRVCMSYTKRQTTASKIEHWVSAPSRDDRKRDDMSGNAYININSIAIIVAQCACV